MCRLSWNLGTSTSWNPKGLSRPVMGLLYFYLLLCRTKVLLSSGPTDTSISEAGAASTAVFSKLWVKRQGYKIFYSLSFHYVSRFLLLTPLCTRRYLSAATGTSLQQQVPTALSRPIRPMKLHRCRCYNLKINFTLLYFSRGAPTRCSCDLKYAVFFAPVIMILLSKAVP